ncbi:hypothetical protein VM1G_11866 [Cytospora mali]|uniref:Uncharacterized protein n=1 Tax=Cytospora mali TaxID=578113 RepID=A0A194W983_CYTMA|nr:hypothetical protein VM1G_11866 [Valsa mali]
MRVRETLRVNIRRNGRRWVYLARRFLVAAAVEDPGAMDEEVDVFRECVISMLVTLSSRLARGPIIIPMLKVMGNKRKALDWYFFSLTISLIIVRSTPTLPLVTPPRERNNKACQNVVLKPKPTHDIMVPVRPIMMTFLRPKRPESATRPHIMAVRNWAAVKLAWSTPAWLEMTESGSEGSNHFSW